MDWYVYILGCELKRRTAIGNKKKKQNKNPDWNTFQVVLNQNFLNLKRASSASVRERENNIISSVECISFGSKHDTWWEMTTNQQRKNSIDNEILLRFSVSLLQIIQFLASFCYVPNFHFNIIISNFQFSMDVRKVQCATDSNEGWNWTLRLMMRISPNFIQIMSKCLRRGVEFFQSLSQPASNWPMKFNKSHLWLSNKNVLCDNRQYCVTMPIAFGRILSHEIDAIQTRNSTNCHPPNNFAILKASTDVRSQISRCFIFNSKFLKLGLFVPALVATSSRTRSLCRVQGCLSIQHLFSNPELNSSWLVTMARIRFLMNLIHNCDTCFQISLSRFFLYNI